MTITPFPVNPLSENCYIVSDDTREAVIIDCGAYYDEEKAAIAQYIQDNDLKPVAHLLTHAHFDHFWGADYIFELYGLQPRCPQLDRPFYDNVEDQVRQILNYSIRCASTPAGEDITTDTVIRFGNHRLTVIPCPGHTPGGNHWDLINALKHILKTLPDNVIVYPGHGPKTTVAYERQNNPYLFG